MEGHPGSPLHCMPLKTDAGVYIDNPDRRRLMDEEIGLLLTSEIPSLFYLDYKSVTQVCGVFNGGTIILVRIAS